MCVICMQNSVVLQKYPDRIVPASFMNNAITINDISKYVTYDLSQNMNKSIGKLQYCKDWMYIDLWEFHLLVKSDSTAYLGSFDTANLDGVSHEDALRSDNFDHVHILFSPVKYIWRELFSKVLDICNKQHINVLTLTPLGITDSFFFYQKMCNHFSDRIASFFEVDWWDMVINLK